jgi:steroid delta-isomerase-like uncharacterized protein
VGEQGSAEERLDEVAARELTERAFAIFNAHDPDRLVEVFAPDVVFHDDAWPQVLHGLAEFSSFLQRIWRSLPDATWQIIEGPYVSQDGRTMATRSRITGHMLGPLDPPGFAPTGREVEIEYAGFFTVEEGLVRRGRVIVNLQAVAGQMGAVPPPGGGMERVVVWLQQRRAARMRRRSAGGERGEEVSRSIHGAPTAAS